MLAVVGWLSSAFSAILINWMGSFPCCATNSKMSKALTMTCIITVINRMQYIYYSELFNIIEPFFIAAAANSRE
jgi:hypothetical protein